MGCHRRDLQEGVDRGNQLKLNLGCGKRALPGFLNVDRLPGKGIDFVLDLEDYPWPWPDGSIQQINARHIIEHMVFPERFIREIYRVLKSGGLLSLVAPHARHWSTFVPGHRSFWTERSMSLFVAGEPDYDSLDQDAMFDLLTLTTVYDNFLLHSPFSWFLWAFSKIVNGRFQLSAIAERLPLGPPIEIRWVLKKVGKCKKGGPRYPFDDGVTP